jgi:hypothetical protein
MGDSRTKSTPEVGTQQPPAPAETALVRGDAQEIAHTASRRSGPRRWLRAVTWLIGAGHHPKTNATTQRVAELLAADMDYDTGHVLYRLQHRAALIPRATVARHVGYLRELGALAWVEHGSRTNVRRLMGLTGYAATATVYAAVIPPSYDHAMGHRIVGSGYEARIVVDYRDQPKPVDNSPVENPGTEGRETPSLTMVKEVGQVEVEGGVTTTGKPVANNPATPPTPKASNSRRKRQTILGRTITAAGIQLGDKLAHAIRRRFPWTRRANHDQIRWVCADMAEQRWTEAQALDFVGDVAFVHRSAGILWQPERPHALIAAALLAEQRTPGPQAMTDAEWDAYHQQRAAEQQALEAQRAADNQAERDERTDEDRRIAREYGWQDMFEVARHYDDDPEDALDLYGLNLCSRAAGLTASAHFSQGAFA